jgi:ribosome biogenesis GTPase
MLGLSDSPLPLWLTTLGWSDFFASQIGPADAGFAPRRVAAVHRARVTTLSESGLAELGLPLHTNTGDLCVGDWVLADSRSETLHRRLDRKTLLQRQTETARSPQLAAANIDTLFIVTSCNADFNVARLERYLVLANESGTSPVILLTKADTADDVHAYRREAEALQRGVPVVIVNPRSGDAALTLAEWCAVGRTVALVGSSGVGKSTLVNTLAGPAQASPQETGGVREGDDKGRHTTTSRSIHAIAGGGWVIDTPGTRALHVGGTAEGIETLFAEITELEPLCKFRDCTHAHEPGCAVRAAVANGTLDPNRLTRWRKLIEESRTTTSATARPQGGNPAAGRSRRR